MAIQLHMTTYPITCDGQTMRYVISISFRLNTGTGYSYKVTARNWDID